MQVNDEDEEELDAERSVEHDASTHVSFDRI